MRIGKIEVKRRVWIGLGCAVVTTAVWWGWTQRTRPLGAASVRVSQPFVRVAGQSNNNADQILRERADLFDPRPLFFPTEWNYGQQPLPDNLLRQPGQVFESFGPKPTFTDQDLKLTVPESEVTPEKPADVLAQGNEAPFAGIGEVDVQREPLPERSAFVEVRDLKNQKAIIEQPLTNISIPKPDYSPVEFIVAVSAGGGVGEPVLASSSGWDEVDAFFRSYLVKTFRLGERLNPGHYRVFIGP